MRAMTDCLEFCVIKSKMKKSQYFLCLEYFQKQKKNYPIIHREALAIVFAMEKFYKLYGHYVKIFIDQKPLQDIFDPSKAKPAVVANRLQRYILRMAIFDFKLKYRKGKDNCNADCLS
jgi:RNase H-like domain found in reverse transcriptase